MTRSGWQSVRPVHARDTDATAFTLILTELISRIPGAHSAALVDGRLDVRFGDAAARVVAG